MYQATADPTQLPQVASANPSTSSDTRSLAALDIDGDGIFERAFGDPTARVVRIISANGALLHTIGGGSTDVRFGWSLAVADLDGDGDQELLVGDPGYSNSRGRVSGWDFSGGTATALFSRSAGSSGSANYGLGYSVDGLGDLDGDGDDEWIAGAPANPLGALTQPGFARIYSGTSSAYNQLVGAVVGERFGFSVARLGDIDGDGQIEIGIGGPAVSEADSAAMHDGDFRGQGGVYIVGPSPSGYLVERTLQPTNALQFGFGFSIDTGGDMNPDYSPLSLAA